MLELTEQSAASDTGREKGLWSVHMGSWVLSCPKVTHGEALTSVLTCSRQGGPKRPLQV